MSRWHADRTLQPLLALAALLSVAVLLLVLAFVVREAWPVLSASNWQHFVFDDAWYPLEGRFGLAPMLLASLVAAFGAIALAAPIGLGCAIFSAYFAPKPVAKVFRAMLALLAGIPSVVFGLWGLTVLVPLIARWQAPGTSLLAAILILTLMILPTVALTSASALQAVPAAWLQGAAALGLGRRATVIGVAVPAARGAIVSGVLLALARALGETMAVLMVAGNVVQFPKALLEPVRVLTVNIALEMAYATGTHRGGLFASGLVLTLLVLVLALMANASAARVRHAA